MTIEFQMLDGGRLQFSFFGLSRTLPGGHCHDIRFRAIDKSQAYRVFFTKEGGLWQHEVVSLKAGEVSQEALPLPKAEILWVDSEPGVLVELSPEAHVDIFLRERQECYDSYLRNPNWSRHARGYMHKGRPVIEDLLGTFIGEPF